MLGKGDRLIQDLRYAFRSLRSKPGFVVVTVGTLALGIGANTAIFSLISAVLLRPLPFAEPARLVQLYETDPRNGQGAVRLNALQAWREAAPSIEGITTFTVASRNLVGDGEPERLAAVSAEHNLFAVLGVTAAVGRVFRDDDPLEVAVISDRLWRARFSGDPAVIGRRILLNSQPHTVIGVTPPGFEFPYRASGTDLWIPWRLPVVPPNSSRRADGVLGRLRPGVAVETARRELDAVSDRGPNATAKPIDRRRTIVTPLSEVVAGKVRPALLTLWGAVGVVLLIACANVMNLLLTRAAGRSQEIALRTALGASRGRLIQQLLTESVLIGMAGALAGLVIARLSSNALLNLVAERIPRAAELSTFDWRVFSFLLVAGVGAGIFFGLLPALAASKLDVQKGLRESRSGGRGGAGWSGARLRDGLVVAEVAMAFLLVIGAGLLLSAFLRLQKTPVGFVTEQVLTMHMSVALSDYPQPGSYARYVEQLEEKLKQVPGVQSAGFIQYLPLQTWGWWAGFSIQGRTAQRPEDEPRAELRYVSPSYFGALGIPLRQGRLFDARDRTGGPTALVVNETLARRYFPNEDPVGRVTNRGTIIGVVGDVRQSGLDQPPAPEIYYCFAQNFTATSDAGVSLVVRARTKPEALINDVRRAIQQVNPNQTFFRVRTMQQVVAESLGDLNLYLWLIALFAGLALVLAISGIYGVVSYAVTGRTQEFAIRLALGAERRQISALVLRHGLVLVALGLTVGVAGAFALSQTLRSLADSVERPDAMTLATVALLVTGVALTACLIPAVRAMRVDPNVALKYE